MLDISYINPVTPEEEQQPAVEPVNKEVTCYTACSPEALGYIIRLLRWQLYLTALLLFVCLTKE